MSKRQDAERVVAMELSQNDIRELHTALRERTEAMGKLGKKLRDLGCSDEANNLEMKASDLNQRLATQLAAELDEPPEVTESGPTHD